MAYFEVACRRQKKSNLLRFGALKFWQHCKAETDVTRQQFTDPWLQTKIIESSNLLYTNKFGMIFSKNCPL